MTEKTVLLGTLAGTTNDLAIRQEHFKTHAAVLGMTGSGKTGALIGMLEEFVDNGTPMVIVDIKGDMANLVLQDDHPRRDRMDVRILTPGADHGESINVLAELANPNKLTSAVSGLLTLVGEKADPLKSKAHPFISAILEHQHKNKGCCELETLVELIQEPPFDKMGAMTVESVYPEKARQRLAGKINSVLTAPSFKWWREGIGIDMDPLLQSKDGRVPVIIYSVAHLFQDVERMFALSVLLEEMVQWMRRQKGSTELKCELVVDECVDLIPPVKEPITKAPLLAMLKQGRAFGLGVMLSTQNTMDLDYKAMANCQTWIIGRLQTANDRKRVIEGVCNSGAVYDKKSLSKRIGNLHPREFLLAGTIVKPGAGNERAAVVFHTRKVDAELRGPMTEGEIGDLFTSGAVKKPGPKSVVNMMADVIKMRFGGKK